MKAATGELQLTVITLIAIAAVIGFFWIMWDPIKATIQGQWDKASSGKDNAANMDNGTGMIVKGYEFVIK